MGGKNVAVALEDADLRRAVRLTAIEWGDRIEAGMVRVNGDTTGVDPHAPFGGTTASASGSREQASAAREFYTVARTVQVQV
jgi:aldehyde dehydrogenase (NAD+)